MAGIRLRDYVLSHHEPGDYDRCLELRFRSHTCHFCARCAGWYVSFCSYWASLLLGVQGIAAVVDSLLVLLPFPAVLEWSLHKLNLWQGTNVTRVASGLPLGLGFAGILWAITYSPWSPLPWAVIVLYTLIVVSIGGASRRNIASSRTRHAPSRSPEMTKH